MERPSNIGSSLYAQQQADIYGAHAAPNCHAVTRPAELQKLRFVPASELLQSSNLLASGDRLRLTVSGDADEISGFYVVEADGSVHIQGQLRIHAAGKTVTALQNEIAQQLIAGKFVRELPNGVRARQIEFVGVPVSVTGAVFEQGMVRVGDRAAEVRNLNISNDVTGDVNVGRTVTTALRAAGGARPDADPASVYVIRGKIWTQLDLSGALESGNFYDLQVTDGDRIIIASVGCARDYMVRPSAITAPGIRVYISNLSRPGSNNAASGIGKDSTNLPYGTRFLQALVAANCVGGSAMNAGRSAVLISRNPLTGKSIVLSRSVERLVRGARRDAFDPYLMPGDAIACYDSAAMNLRDIVSTFSESITPYILFNNVK